MHRRSPHPSPRSAGTATPRIRAAVSHWSRHPSPRSRPAPPEPACPAGVTLDPPPPPGLAEPGNLFKNMTAMLRDVTACYDETIRNSCGSSIVKFYSANGSIDVTPGDHVGILAATAVANAAYKAVLDPNQNNMTSWDSMKEVLHTKASSKTGENDRNIILYLSKCSCENKFCMERAALAVQACLKRIKVEDCTTEFTIHIMIKKIALSTC